MGTMIQVFKKNAVLRFWLSYMFVLALFFFVCLAGFREALHIVRDNVIEENQNLLRQGIGEADNKFGRFRIGGLNLATSASLKQLGRFTDKRDMEYYEAAQNVLQEYADTIKYYDTYSLADVFIYVDSLDRVIYDNAVYHREVFQRYPDSWGIAMEEWMALCQDTASTPSFYVTESGELLYLFPCIRSPIDESRLGTVIFRIDTKELVGHMNFLENYSGYSLFIHENGEMLFGMDGLGLGDRLVQEMVTQPGVYFFGEEIVIAMDSQMGEGCVYTLILSTQEAMARLWELQRYICLLLVLAAVAGTAFAFFFAARSGKPINSIARKLWQKEENYSTDLNSISQSIDQMIQEQKEDQAALRQTFFHNLLKADFLSRAELEYMADRAGLQLTGTVYCAAAIRLFPEIDADSIDGRTVEEARVLQALVSDRLKQEYPWASWSYKKNTLVTLYIIEAKNQETLWETLTQIILWLRSVWNADGYWGIGSPCNDLMYFWKSTEEADAALDAQEDGPGRVIRLYSEIHRQDDSYYLPYSIEERLVQSLRAGDFKTAESVLHLIQTENFVYRSLGRRQLLKLNHALCEIIAQQAKGLSDREERFIRLNVLLMEEGKIEDYFSGLGSLCGDICSSVASRKSRKRNEKIKEILRFVEENYQNPGMGLGLVSQQFKLSEGYLSAFFKEELQVNFGDYLENLRIGQACRLLKEGELVANIAEKTGYNSVQSFRRAFKRVMGVSPSEYRG